MAKTCLILVPKFLNVLYIKQFWDNQTSLEKQPVPELYTEFDSEIPEIYHYTWFSCRNFTTIHFLSILSVLKTMTDSDSSKIIIHTDCAPNTNMTSKPFEKNGMSEVVEDSTFEEVQVVKYRNSTYNLTYSRLWDDIWKIGAGKIEPLEFKSHRSVTNLGQMLIKI